MIVDIAKILVPSVLLALVGAASFGDDETPPEVAAPRVTPFLLFQDGNAEEAMTFYTGLFEDGRILAAERYGADTPGAEGTIQRGSFLVAGQKVRCTDSVAPHAFGFTPSISLFVDCSDDEEIERLAAALEEGGEVLMPLGDYGFSKRFAWVQDRYGVSWQLSVPFDDEEEDRW